MGAELLNADRQTEMTVIVAFRNYANSPIMDREMWCQRLD